MSNQNMDSIPHMELTDIRNKLLEIFFIEDVSELGDALLNASLHMDYEKFEAVKSIFPDFNQDYLQRVYQYHLADREKNKQDFTPASLARLLANITDDSHSDMVDLCAGSGALTIQAWVKNPDRHFACYELDDVVIPFLIFNLAIRNMNATVYHGDCLTQIFHEKWELEKGEKFSAIKYEKCESDKQSAIQYKMESRAGTEQLGLF